MAWLLYVGRRRPASLADQVRYREPQHRTVTPKPKPLPKGVKGKALTGRKK